MIIQNKSLKRKLKYFSTAKLLIIIAGWIISGFVFGCGANVEEKQQVYKDILGYWKSYRTDITNEEPGLIKVAINSRGKLEQAIIYESGNHCRIWINDDNISFKDGHLEFWDGEFKGEMSEDKNSIKLEYGSRFGNSIPFIWERIQNQKSIAFLDSLEASQGGKYEYRIPVETDDGWECANLENVNINKDKIFECVSRIWDGKYKDIHSLLIVKDKKLVLEEYFGAESKIRGPFVNQVFRDRVQILASVTKSVNSALIGIAFEQGFLKDLEAPAFELFPEYDNILDNEKRKIQLKHLLTMSAGFSWNELDIPFSNNSNDAAVMHQKSDLIKFCLEKPIVNTPGKQFKYNSGLSDILGEILKRSSGMSADKFAEEYLFAPLGISAYKWSKKQSGMVHTDGGLALRARDMAKIGQLYLDNGKWHNKQIVPEKWVKESTRIHIKTSSGGYGYQWWMRNFTLNDQKIDSFYAIGNAGQFIFVFPELDMIIVSTAHNFDNSWSRRFYSMLRKYILPAVVLVSH